MGKLYGTGVLSDNNPVGLQRKVFVELMLQFGRRGREGLRTMRKDTFAVKRDGSGRRYITVVFNELTKNHQNDSKHDSVEDQLMFEQDSYALWRHLKSTWPSWTLPVMTFGNGLVRVSKRRGVVRNQANWCQHIAHHDARDFIGWRTEYNLYEPLSSGHHDHCLVA